MVTVTIHSVTYRNYLFSGNYVYNTDDGSYDSWELYILVHYWNKQGVCFCTSYTIYHKIKISKGKNLSKIFCRAIFKQTASAPPPDTREELKPLCVQPRGIRGPSNALIRFKRRAASKHKLVTRVWGDEQHEEWKVTWKITCKVESNMKKESIMKSEK